MNKSFLACALVVMASTPALSQVPGQPELIKVEGKAAITKSIMPAKAGGALELEIVTVTEAPLFLKPNKIKTPSGKFVQTTPVGAAPAPVKSGSVKQRWSWKVQPAEKGKYTAVFGTGAFPGQGNPNTNLWLFEFSINN